MSKTVCYKCLFDRPHAFHDDGTGNETWVSDSEIEAAVAHHMKLVDVGEDDE